MPDPTDGQWRAAADAVTSGGTEGDVVRRVAQAIATAVDDAIQGGAYCIDCGAAMDDWRGHGEECVYREEDQDEPPIDPAYAESVRAAGVDHLTRVEEGDR